MGDGDKWGALIVDFQRLVKWLFDVEKSLDTSMSST